MNVVQVQETAVNRYTEGDNEYSKDTKYSSNIYNHDTCKRLVKTCKPVSHNLQPSNVFLKRCPSLPCIAFLQRSDTRPNTFWKIEYNVEGVWWENDEYISNKFVSEKDVMINDDMFGLYWKKVSNDGSASSFEQVNELKNTKLYLSFKNKIKEKNEPFVKFELHEFAEFDIDLKNVTEQNFVKIDGNYFQPITTRLLNLSHLQMTTTTSAALGLLGDENMSKYLIANYLVRKFLSLGIPFRRFIGLSPALPVTLNNNSICVRTADGAYFDKSSLASLIAHLKHSHVHKGTLLTIKCTKSSAAFNSNEIPPCSFKFDLMGNWNIIDINKHEAKEWTTVAHKVVKHINKKGRLLSTTVKHGESIYKLYIIEVFAKSHENVSTIPTFFSPNLWKQYIQTAKCLCDYFVNKVLVSQSQKHDLKGISIASGGMKTLAIGWEILQNMNLKENFPNVEYMSGCSGGLWSIYLYDKYLFNFDATTIINYIKRTRKTLKRYKCYESGIFHLIVNHLSKLNQSMRLLKWIQNSNYDWYHFVKIILEAENDEDIYIRNLKVNISSPFVMLCEPTQY